MIFAGVIAIVIFFIIIQYPIVGLCLTIIAPLFKDILYTATDSFSNLLFIIMVATIVSIILKYSNGFFRLSFHKVHLFLLLLFLCAIQCSIFYTNSPNYGQEKLIKFLFFNIGLFVSSIVLFQSKKNTDLFVRFLFLSITIFSIINSIIVSKAILNGDFIKMAITRLTLTGGDPIGMARVMGLGLVIGAVLVFRTNRKSTKLFLWLTMFPIFFSMIITNTRGPIIALLFTLIVFLFLMKDIKFTTKLLFISFISIISIGLVLVLPENLTNRFELLFQGNQSGISHGISTASSSELRLIYYSRVLNYLFDHPLEIMLGTGIGNFSQLVPGNDTKAYPHSIFMEILFEQGLFGLSIFCLGLLFLAKDVLKSIKKIDDDLKQLFIIFLLLFIYFLTNAFWSGDLSDNRYIWLFWGGLLGLLTLQKKAEITL